MGEKLQRGMKMHRTANKHWVHYVGLEEVEELQADNGLDRTGKEYDFVEVKVRNNIKVNQFKS